MIIYYTIIIYKIMRLFFMNTKEIKHLVNELFNGEYSDILKPLSVGNTFLAKSTLDSYIREFSGKRKLNAIELFTSENSKLHYEDDGSVIKVIKNLIDNKDISGIDNIDFNLTANNALLYGDFVRFIYAFYFGGYKEELNILVKNIYELISKISHNIVSGFKNSAAINRVSIVITSSIYRAILDVLSDFSEIAGDARSRAEVMYYKSYITCNVMSNYRGLVGPDMIKTALCFEEIEEFEKAEKMYDAVITDFECVLSGITYHFDNYNIDDKAENYVALVSLWQACDGINRIEEINKYEAKMEAIEEAIKKLNSI